MANRKLFLQCVAIFGLLAQQSLCRIPVDEDVRARMEEKAISSISLRSLEEMVEKQRYPINPSLLRFYGLNEPTSGENAQESAFSSKYVDPVGDYHIGEYFYQPSEEIESEASRPISLFRSPFNDFNGHSLDSTAWSHPAENRYSDDLISSRSSRHSNWEERDDIQPRQEQTGENGCRTVVQEVPEEKGSGSRKVKGIIISKECEYPKGYGPDAHIPGIEPPVQKSPEIITDTEDHSRSGLNIGTKRLGDSPLSTSDTKEEKVSKDPLAMDYIDKMFATHFKNFPSFKFRIPSLEKQHEKFSETLTELEEKDHSSEPENIQAYSRSEEKPDDDAVSFVPGKSHYELSKRSPSKKNRSSASGRRKRQSV